MSNEPLGGLASSRIAIRNFRLCRVQQWRILPASFGSMQHSLAASGCPDTSQLL